MARKLPKCPLCGAKCLKDTEDGSVYCSRWALDCAYGVFDVDAHRALCARLAEKPKGKDVIFRGWASEACEISGIVWEKRHDAGKHPRRVLILDLGPARKRRGRK